MRAKMLGELLIEADFISREQLDHALGKQKIPTEKLGQILLKLGYITEDILIEFLGKQHGTSSINLYKEVIDTRVVNLIPKNAAEKYRAIPIAFKLEEKTKKLVVVMANPSDLEAIDTFTFITGSSIHPVFTREEHFKWLIESYYYKRWELK